MCWKNKNGSPENTRWKTEALKSYPVIIDLEMQMIFLAIENRRDNPRGILELSLDDRRKPFIVQLPNFELWI